LFGLAAHSFAASSALTPALPASLLLWPFSATLHTPNSVPFASISAFASGREFAASLGLTPRQNSTGGKERLGRITKMGDRYLRKLLVVGACATLCHRKGHNDALRMWADQLLARKTVKHKFNLTAVALANKVAHIVFALMTRGGEYNELPIVA
jgi:transposase